MKVCVIDGCGKKVEARGWCWSHWRRWRRYGDPVSTLTCQRCEGQFVPARISAMYCPECRLIEARERAAAWASEHPEHVQQRNRDHYLKGEPERALRRQLRQAEAPERARASKRSAKLRRRARALGAEGSHTAGQWTDLCEAHGWFCDYCGTELDQTTVTRDHVIPLTRGGTDYIDNLVPCCHSCNSRKHTSTVDEFLARLEVVA